MSRPRLLDLFCGGGGAATGYARAGFEVVGVDLVNQPHYPFEFIQADALTYLHCCPKPGFDAIHASPPCQHWTAYKRRPDHVKPAPDLIAPTRALLRRVGLPFVIENVRGAPLDEPAMLCGSMFDPPLDVQRHRYFEWAGFNWLGGPLYCRHKLWAPRFPAATNRKPNSRRTVEIGVWRIPLETQKRAMGVDWGVTLEELSQMIPPAYTELIGLQLRKHLDYATRRSDNDLQGAGL